jgi:ubiquinone/menaquinone biosynthesis C-methylase UbiE
MNFSDPKSNILQMGLRDGMQIADIGAGSGHYALAAAAGVGRDGKVYAIDVQEEVLKHLKDSAHTKGIRNIETVWGNAEKTGGTKLRAESMDAVICSNVLFQVENKETFIQEIIRILKKDGKLLVIDWAGAYGGVGPRPDHVVSEHVAEALFIEHHFIKVKNFRAGAHHYGIVFKKP